MEEVAGAVDGAGDASVADGADSRDGREHALVACNSAKLNRNNTAPVLHRPMLPIEQRRIRQGVHQPVHQRGQLRQSDVSLARCRIEVHGRAPEEVGKIGMLMSFAQASRGSK
ncbi:MAG TPA: hypothetical protein VMG12_33200 [Polyangiaceae bacterium]|nr:hypothetical protein [Polyangiaceae bacterium]